MPRKRSDSRNETPKLGRRFEQALLFATQKHAGQTRKASTAPYIGHLLGVTSLVLEAGGDEDLAIAALLHDVVEDCGGMPMLKEVRKRFGKRVAHIVDGCTDAYDEPKPPWYDRKTKYLERLRTEDDEVRLVSCADKLHNVGTILRDYRKVGESVWERFRGKRDGTLWYYRALADEFARGKPNRLVRELERVVRELEREASAGNEIKGLNRKGLEGRKGNADPSLHSG